MRCFSSIDPLRSRWFSVNLGGLFLLGTGSLLWSQGFAPEEATKKMTIASGFEVSLAASEPLIKQPVAIEFDDRGRPWVIQYLQYPNPAGLKRVKVDRYSRTTYDRIPEPPPRGPQGADRITILTEADAKGRFVKGKDFVQGLNLATGLAFGHGGVFVLQVPYLLFYPDRDGNDVPDDEPQVLLKGFGMEDAHSVANSLTWGPDGWLYGCQGSTVTANIRGIVFQQGVWRYHPITHRFELFCDGGGNSWGLDFDRHGNLFYCTNHGSHVMLHGVQGGYYWKQFDKHGAFQNPFTYGYFDHVPHKNFKGGHVTTGGIVYQGDSFPAKYRGKFIAADLLGHGLYWHDIAPRGTTFQTSHGGELLQANDTWFAPCDVTMGPDGAVYVADWHDQRTGHPDPDAEWDRTNGRIFRVQVQGVKPAPFIDLTGASSAKLVEMLSHSNNWYVRRARRLLADRRDPEMILPLRRIVQTTKDDQLALEALWALYVSGGFNEHFATAVLDHSNPHLRRWTIRFLGDENKVGPPLARRLAELAALEKDPSVRGQLAATARRLPPGEALPIIANLTSHAEDLGDPHLPLLLWWAVERHAIAARPALVKQFAAKNSWDRPLIREAILGNLMRRWAAERSTPGFLACAELLESAPNEAEKSRLLARLDQGLRDHPGLRGLDAMGSLFTDLSTPPKSKPTPSTPPAQLPDELTRQLTAFWKTDLADPTLLRLLIHAGHEPAQQRVLRLAGDQAAPRLVRLAMIQLLSQTEVPQASSMLLGLVTKKESEEIHLAALDALRRFDSADIARSLMDFLPRQSAKVRTRAIDLLLSRKDSAERLLRAVEVGKLDAKWITVDQLRVIALHQDKSLDGLVRKHWGNIAGGTPEDKLAEMRRLMNDLRAGKGDLDRGKKLFEKHCSSCHQLFGQGTKLGPDLTTANRHDLPFLLQSMVDPSAMIRREYLVHIVETKDGRVLTGMIVDQAPNKLVLANAKNERETIAIDQIAGLRESPVSLMPENLHRELRPQELRDLFGYLQKK